MRNQPQILNKTVRRLTAAEGYLELDLPGYALEQLESIEDPGPFEPLVHFMTGEALKGQQRYREAIEPLKRAAQTIPAPHNCIAWKSLGECFRQGGQHALADVVEMFADSPPSQSPVQIQLMPGAAINLTISDSEGRVDISDLSEEDDDRDA